MSTSVWQLTFATLTKRWGSSIKKMKWKLFFERHRFTTINCDGTLEVDVKKVDLNAFIQGESAKHRENVHIIQIGVLKASSHRKIEMQKDPHDGQMITTPSRLSGLHIQQSVIGHGILAGKYLAEYRDSLK